MPTDAEITFADHMGRFYARRYGFPPMVGRLLGYLAVCDPPEQSIGELAEALLASRSAIAGAVKVLEATHAIRRSRAAGERMDRVRIDLTSPQSMGMDITEYEELRELAQEGLEVVRDAPMERRAVLLEMVGIRRVPGGADSGAAAGVGGTARGAGRRGASPGLPSAEEGIDRDRRERPGDRGRRAYASRSATRWCSTSVDLTVAEGTIFGLLGPNGAGKTTMVRILSTLIPADSGQVRVAGHDVAADPDGVRAAIGVTGQFSAVDDLFTGEENLRLMADLNHLGRAEGRRRVAELLDGLRSRRRGPQAGVDLLGRDAAAA